MMTEPKILKEGQLPASKTTAYAAPTGKATIVSSISLVNTHTSDVTVDLWIKKSGSTSRHILKTYTITVNDRYTDTLAYALAAADVIEWAASVADKIDGIITGCELLAQ